MTLEVGQSYSRRQRPSMGYISHEPLAHTGFLFAEPSFWTGVGRLVDFGQGLSRYNYSLTPDEADYYALLSDWLAVGGDIGWSLESYKSSVK